MAKTNAPADEVTDPNEPASAVERRYRGHGVWVGLAAVLALFIPRTSTDTATHVGDAPAVQAERAATLVVLHAGRPVRGALVEVEGETYEVDAFGRLEVPAGAAFTAVAPGFTPVAGTSGEAGDETFVALHLASPIAGTVRDSAGNPVPLAAILAESTLVADNPSNPVPSAQTQSGSDGAFLLDAPPSGPVRVTVRADGFGTETRIVGGRDESGDARLHVTFVLEPAATVAGVVYDPDGAPSVNASVRLVGSGIWPAAVRVTDAEGRYRFGDVPAGIYEVHAHRGGDVSPPTRGLTLETGQSSFVPLRMVRGDSVSGRITSGGAAVPGAEVRMIAGGLTLDPIAAVSDDTGTFRFAALLPSDGARVILVQAAGFVTQSVTIPGDQRTVDIALERTCVVRGIVIDERGRPIEGASVQWLSSTARHPTRAPSATNLGVTAGPVPPIPIGPASATLTVGFGDARSGADGRFELTGIDPGEGRLHASQGGHAPAESDVMSLGPAERVEGVELVMPDGALIDGRVVDARGYGVGGIPIDLTSDRERLPRSTLSTEDGSFTFGGALGTVTLTARPFGAPAKLIVVFARSGERHEVRIELPSALHELRGRVVDSRGFPIPDAALRLVGRSESVPLERIGDSSRDGTFDFGSLPAPPYELTVDHPEYAISEVPIDATDVEVQITLVQGGTIAGSVVDDWRDVPLVGALVTLLDADDAPFDGRAPSVTDGNGAYRFQRVPRGDYRVRAEARGRAPVEASVALDREAVRVETLRVGVAGSVEVEVVGALGYPARGSRVRMAFDAADPIEGVTDARGVVRLDGVLPGERRVTVEHPDAGGATSEPFRVDPDGLTHVRVVLPARVPLGATEVVTDSARERTGVAVMVARVGTEVRLRVVPRSLAARSLRDGDVLVRIDGEDVLSAGQARAALQGEPGTRVRVEVRRGSQTVRRTVEREAYTAI